MKFARAIQCLDNHLLVLTGFLQLLVARTLQITTLVVSMLLNVTAPLKTHKRSNVLIMLNKI